MNELTKKLESIIETLEEMESVLNKSNSNRESVSMSILFKNIEDGILDNIHNANNKQLNHIIHNYTFRYYTEYNTDKDLLKSEINKRTRDIKLNDLGI
jgi:3-dehydroquinate dehydratase